MIDEYDRPFISVYIGDLSLILYNSLKSSEHFKYVLLTGIQKVSKEKYLFTIRQNLCLRCQ